MITSRNFKKVILLIIISLFFPISVFAFSYYSTSTQNFDTSLSDNTSAIFVNPTKIYITQVTTNSELLQRDPGRWVKSLYYYCITRLHFSELPYTYLVDENGIIYQANRNGIGANPELKDVDGSVTIGYLSNNTEGLFNTVWSLNPPNVTTLEKLVSVVLI